MMIVRTALPSTSRCLFLRPVSASIRCISSTSANSIGAVEATTAAAESAPPASASPAQSAQKAAASTIPKSSTPAGTVLKNINYFAKGQDPVAKEDHEYPAWLWQVLADSEKKKGADSGVDADLYSKSKKARREAAKRAAKAAKLAGPTEPVIPLDEQTLDLPYVTRPQEEVKRLVSAAGAIPGVSPTGAVAIGGEDGAQVGFDEAALARDNVKRIRRDKNRKAIKEKNFLTSMS
ncbi:hypothetical protein BJ508DRAFT_364728 [Ascobolus immersus RN42]|uniref:Large ribosomal subunit protein mL54 n=1 Tax=Ascobolus immersus RN42 TaxID=1160509 RepID=A0A3N4HWY0_ASCIM|nr:hypothetical protein BJ508DRAFT_364728 [Ascobolus immersus RN42]